MKTTPTYAEVHNVFTKWLSLTQEERDVIDVVIATALDRKISGDPIWLFVVGPSGCGKTEIIQSLKTNASMIYTLDTLTAYSFISGKIFTKKDSKGKVIETFVGGHLKNMDGKVLVIKDFTTILSMPDKMRYEIYGQLRSIYDGTYEKAFGNLLEPIRVNSTIGIIAGVTPVIDRHLKLVSTLGQRFINVRMHPDKISATEKSMRNLGHEKKMREEIHETVFAYLTSITNPIAMPTFTTAQKERILDLGQYVAPMRTWVHGKIDYKGNVTEMDAEEPELPTRLVKQLTKLLAGIAIVRGHKTIQEEDMKTLIRVACDCPPVRRQKVAKTIYEITKTKSTAFLHEVCDMAKMHRNTTLIVIEKMVAINILERVTAAGNDTFKFTSEFKKYADAALS